MWIFQLVHLWPISVLSCMFQHPFPFHSICSHNSQLLLLKCIIHMSWTSQISTVLILSSAVVFHFASHSDSLIQHQCYSSALVILSKDSSLVAMIYLFPDFFFFFFCPKFSFTYFPSLAISRLSCHFLDLFRFLSWYSCFSLKELLLPHWFFCYKFFPFSHFFFF